MTFWDASALVPLILCEPQTADVRQLYDQDSEVVVWWATRTECLSVLARGVREGRLDASEERQTRAGLFLLYERVFEVTPVEAVRGRAERLLAVHLLRTADAFQLAAALAWARERTAGMRFACLDRCLRDAAWREGFTVLPA